MRRQYAFYKSLRFRFAAVFGSLFLVFLLLAALFLYVNVKRQLENSFKQNLESGAALVLGKTELNPLTIPVPQTGEKFLLLYDNNTSIDTLFPTAGLAAPEVLPALSSHRSVTSTRNLETGGKFIIYYSRTAAGLEQAIGELRSVLFFYLPVAFLLSLMAGYFLSGFLLKPIGQLINQANQNALQSENLLLPVPEVEDELHALTLALNHMLSRLQEVRKQQNTFFASAAHELRTPLSIMLTGLQVSGVEMTDPVSARFIHQQVHEVRRLSALVDNLLLMSRLASRPKEVPQERQMISLAETILENIRLIHSKAVERRQTFRVALLPPGENDVIPFQASQLNILIRNLLDNAIIHGTEDSAIDIQLVAGNGTAIQLIVRNETTQKAMDLGRVTKEFEKGDPFREGFGLGLWIVKELAGLNMAEAGFAFFPPRFVATITFTAPGREVSR